MGQGSQAEGRKTGQDVLSSMVVPSWHRHSVAQTLATHLPCARHCYRSWGRTKNPCGSYILMGKTDHKQGSRFPRSSQTAASAVTEQMGIMGEVRGNLDKAVTMASQR